MEALPLPEGEVIELVQLDDVLAHGGDDLDDEERAALHAELRASVAEAKTGKLIDADEVLAELRAVKFSARALRRAKLVSSWWRSNRRAAPRLFDEELEHAVQQLEIQPPLGVVYQSVEGQVVRRLMLPKTPRGGSFLSLARRWLKPSAPGRRPMSNPAPARRAACLV